MRRCEGSVGDFASPVRGAERRSAECDRWTTHTSERYRALKMEIFRIGGALRNSQAVCRFPRLRAIARRQPKEHIMCDYSLLYVKSRDAQVGDRLVSNGFQNTISRGFSPVATLIRPCVCGPARKSPSIARSSTKTILAR